MIATVLFSVHVRGGYGSWETVNGVGEFAQYTSTVDIVVGEEERRRGEEIWISDSRFGFGFGFGSGFGSGSGFGVGLGVECGTTVHTF